MALTQTQVSQLYVTLFGRASEGAGNTYWQTAAENMAQGATDMLATQAAIDYFGGSLDDDQAFIEHIYLNTLGKTYAEDPEGVDYWVGLLGEGVSRGEVTVGLINAVYDYADSTDPVTKAAYDQFVNRVAVSDYCAENIEGADLDPNDAAAMAVFTGYIAGVTDDPATVTAAQDEILNDATPPMGLTLTADIDDLVGAAGDDVFTAPLTVASTQTLNDFDTLDGAGGSDTLNATLFTPIVAPTLDNVEVLNLRGIGGNLDLVNATGVEQIWTDRSQNPLTVVNVGELAAVGAKGISATAAHVYTVVYDPAITIAATDTQAIALEDAVVTINIGAPPIANVSIASEGTANTVTFGAGLVDGATIQNLAITGAGDLEIDSVNVLTAGTIDASAATGNLNMTVGAAAAANLATGVTTRTVTLGAGDDVLDASAAGILATDKFDGGDGNDLIIVDGTSTTITDDLVANVTNFEELGLLGLNQALSAATYNNLGFNTIKVEDAALGTLNNLSGDIALTLVDTDGVADTITLGVTNAATDDNASFGFTVNGIDASNAAYTVTIADVENVSVTTVDADPLVYQQTVLSIISTEMQNLTITGDEAVFFDGTLNTALKTVDVSGITAASNASAIVPEYAAAIIVGEGVTVTGSAGDDSIGASIESVVTGGAGDDTFVVATGLAADLGEFVTLTDFSAGDMIDFGSPVGAVNEIVEADLGLVPGVSATFADYVSVAVEGAATGDVSYFTFAGDTFLVQDVNADTTGAIMADDIIVKLTGVVDLSGLDVTAAGATTVAIA